LILTVLQQKSQGEEVKQMRGFEISGTKGTYLETEYGQYADTVLGKGDNLEALRAQVTEFVSEPICTSMTVEELAIYVGAKQ